MLERLSPISLQCFNAAKQEARRLKSAELNTRHVVLGLLHQQKSWMAELLSPHNVSTDQLSERIQNSLKPSAQPPPRLAVSTELKAALQLGISLAGSKPVAPAHLLTALLDSDPELRRLLEALDVDVEQLGQDLKAPGGEPPAQQIPVADTAVEGPEPGATGPPAEPSSIPEPQAEHKPTPTLDQYGRDLTHLAREGRLHPIVGREREIATTIEILCRTMKRNPIFVGEPGVGKTALAEGLAQRIVAGKVPSLLRDKRLVELSVSSLVAGASQVGEFERRLQKLVTEVHAAGDVILFIDEAHALMGAGGTYGLQDAATILKPALARGDIVCIGSTTTHEYRKYIEKDGALARRFQPVRVEEPDEETVLHILRVLKPRFEEHFRVSIPDPVLGETYDLAKRYLKNRYFPDKAIDLLERTASRTMLSSGEGSTAEGEERPLLGVDTILSVLSDTTGIPLEKLDQGEMERYLRMEEILCQRVIGQDRAVEAVSSLIRLTKRRLDLDPKRPDGVFLFVGPAGVGKTELAKGLTEFLFGDEDRLIRLDMSEFSAEFTVSRLIGSPPGYVGYDEGGQLTERVRSQPFCVVLLDEIEKAHPDVLNLFLQVFDDGHLTDAQGRTAHFADATIIMTSNLASELWFRRRMGFGDGDRQAHVAEGAVIDVLSRKLPAEFLSRVDQVVVFHPLDDEAILQIARQKLNTIVHDRFARQQIDVTFDPQVVRYVADRGYDPRQGCRHLERVIQREILELLAKRMYRTDWQEVRSIYVTAADGQISVSREPFPDQSDQRPPVPQMRTHLSREEA
ncbi:MAG: ATP-dependent Clp protease ATP-binding subunit [Anaerolineae bacterium]|nr:ATP-dependent Clp protease ATP-binding subunit [Anaerolineae bacterium]